MRVLQIVTLADDDAGYDGPLAVAVAQCLELRARGHDAHLLGGWRGAGTPPERVCGVPAHLFRMRPIAPRLGTAGLFSSRMVRWTQANAASFDVAHLHLARDLAPLAVAAVLRRRGVPYVVQTHTLVQPDRSATARFFDWAGLVHTLREAGSCFVSTPDERDAVVRVSGSNEGLSWLRSGVAVPEQVSAKSAQPQKPLDVVFVARLSPANRVLAFAAAAQRLLDEGITARFRVIGPDGGELAALRRMIATGSGPSTVSYEGTLPYAEALEQVRNADLFVLPTIDEQPYPMMLLEAVAAGVVSICTTRCGLAGVLGRQGAALIANPTDDALYGAMRRLLLSDPARQRISDHAREAAETVCAIGPAVDVLEREYAVLTPPAPLTSLGLTPLRGIALGAALPAGIGRGRREAVAPIPSLLWVASRVTPEHLTVWNALSRGIDLSVALTTDPSPEVAATGLLEGARYPVTHLYLENRRLGVNRPGAGWQRLRELVHARPDVVVLDGDAGLGLSAMAEWAQQCAVKVISTAPAEGPSRAAARATALLKLRVTVDLRTGTGTGTGSAGTSITSGVGRP